MKQKKFDCVRMTREIRDELFRKKEGRSLKDFTSILVREARRSALYLEKKTAEGTPVSHERVVR